MNAQDEINAAAEGKGCLGRSDPDEPVFVLCARDVVAGDVVRDWADRVETRHVGAGTYSASVKAKVAEARQLAAAMDRWPKKKLPD